MEKISFKNIFFITSKMINYIKFNSNPVGQKKLIHNFLNTNVDFIIRILVNCTCTNVSQSFS